MSTEHQQAHDLTCDEAIKRIFDFIDRELDGKSLDEFQKHITACRDCFDHTEFERLLKERIRTMPRGNTDALKERVKKLIESF